MNTFRLLPSLCLAALAASAHAQTVGVSASDNGANTPYSGGNFNGQNGGFGFGVWSNNPTTNNGNNGSFTANPSGNAGGAANNGGGIGSPAWGLFSNAGVSDAVRSVTGGVAIGQTVQVNMDNGFINTGGTVGFGLRNSSNANLFEFFFAGGASTYTVAGSANQAFGGFTGGGLISYFTMTSATAFTFQVSSNGGTSFSTFTGSIQNSGTIDNIRIFNATAGSGSNFDAYFNNLRVSTPTWNANASNNFSSIGWAGGAAGALPVNGGSIAFNGGTGSITATNDAAANLSSVYGITFNATTGVNANATTYTVAGNALTVNAGGITNNSTNLQTFSNNLTVGAAQTWNTGSGGITVSGNISGSANLTKSGTGTLTLTGSNGFSGAVSATAGTIVANATTGQALGSVTSITVTNAGTTLTLGKANQINDSAAMTLAGGTFNTGGFSETLGALTLTGNSIIDLASGASQLRFAASSGSTWTGTLRIYNWTGNAITGGGTDQIFFGTSSSGLNSGQIAQVLFYSDAGTTLAASGGAILLATGELVPVPEPGTVVAGVLALAGVAWRVGRRGRLRRA